MIWIMLACNLLFIPLLLIGVIRKTKALMQTRYGAPLFQPFYDLAKFFKKSETISETASWIFIWAPRVGLITASITAVLVPWAGVFLPASWAGASNFLLVLYLIALGKFFTMLAAMDTGSAFGGLGASREATISLLVEPMLVIGLGALALATGHMDLSTMAAAPVNPLVAALVGIALIVAALAELSRMPVDDPTTHLELTMVHEAMILENSGRNLALVEYAGALRACIYFGLATQTILHALPVFTDLSPLLRYGISLLALFLLGVLVAVAEGLIVKLKWRAVPHFLAFGIAFSLLAALVAVAQG